MWCELLLEVGGFGLQVRLTIVVPSCADFGLRVPWRFMLRFVDLISLYLLPGGRRQYRNAMPCRCRGPSSTAGKLRGD